ncbi:flagellar biosynthetic protein FliO [Bacillus rubiinfantis]|uniref:flagellar biosynthetic protein FliO n=1 Tax=Bacillus rubiinfantis TaxID=1499680 RepID=UPI0005A6113D|nr:flagellar biosynthetic protein FliO [Bacillus rubiinfantis]
MKRIMSLFAIVFYLLSYQSAALATGVTITAAGEPSVYDTIKKGEKQSSPVKNDVKDSGSSIFSLFIKFIFSFILVIFLLFVLLRYLAKRNRPLSANGPIIPLGDYVLGNNRSVQLLLIGQTIYVVGVGDSVTLLRTISQGEEYQHLLESLETQEEQGTVSPLSLKQDTKNVWNSIFQKQLNLMKKRHEEE